MSTVQPPPWSVAPFSNTCLLDDILGDQFVYWGASQTFAPSPIGSVPSAGRVTQFSRGLVPRPDPKNGLPIIAILGVAQNNNPNFPYVSIGGVGETVTGASWLSPQNLPSLAQVNVLERVRYVW